MFLVVDKDANPSTAVPHNEIKNSDVEDVITVEVNNKHEIGHRLLKLPANCFHCIFTDSLCFLNFSEWQYFGRQQ